MKNNKIMTVLVIVLAVLLFASVVVIVSLLTAKNKEESHDIYETMEDEEVTKNDGTISIPGYSSITFRKGKTLQNVSLYNPAQNNCYFQISIYMGTDDNKTLLWKSELMEPGTKVVQLELTEALEAGTYEGFIQYDCYTMDGSQTALNGGRTNLTLIVK